MSLQFKTDLKYEVDNDAGISALIGNKFHPSLAPQNVSAPYAVYQIVSNQDDLCHDGPVQIFECRIQIDIVASSVLETEQIKDAFVTLLNGLSRSIGSGSTTKIEHSRFDGEIDFPEVQEKTFRKTIDFLMAYK